MRISGFDSIAERKRWFYLKMLLSNGVIKHLTKQVPFVFSDGSRYVADFVYYEDGKKIVEDVKHPMLLYAPKFRNNRRKMKAEYGLNVFPINPGLVHLPRSLAVY